MNESVRQENVVIALEHSMLDIHSSNQITSSIPVNQLKEIWQFKIALLIE